MNPNDRLIVRSLMLDECYAEKTQLQHELAKLRKQNEENNNRIAELEAEVKQSKSRARTSRSK